MSIVVNLYYTGIDGSARRFMEEMESSGAADLIRKEDGNERYEYFLPVHDSETVLLIDQWRDQEALDVHHASPMMGKIAQLREKYDLHMKVERYVTDEGGIPDSDTKFIKK
ncbi:MAG: putative quinol monooxygenase [Lachnospiraceae bacterium]